MLTFCWKKEQSRYKPSIAFDFGASTGRAILAEYKNGKLSYNEVHRFDNNLVKKDGLLCLDFDYLLNEVKKAIDMCENFDSLAFDTWGVDYGMLDKDGKLISLPVCYRDDRTKNEVSKVFEKMPDKKLYSLTGNQIMAINTLFAILRFQDRAFERWKQLFAPPFLHRKESKQKGPA